MECYFGSISLPEENELQKTAVVSFSIPELGIRFKAPFDALDKDHSDFASLLALLEFIDSNQKYFRNSAYQMYCNNLKVVNQVNEREEIDNKYAIMMEKAEGYKKKYRFSLDWVPSDNNPATN